ncbi:leukotriene B4 receptor 1-like [Rhinoraja longicauda]
MDVGGSETDRSAVVQNALVCVVLGLASLLGIPGNGMVIWVILFHMQRQRSPTVVLLLNLAIADLLVLVTLPLWTYSFVHGWPFGQIFCKLLTFVVHCNMYVSIFLITAMSGERFAAVRYPFSSQRWRTVAVVWAVVLLAWVLAALFAAPVLMYQELGHDDQGQDQCMYGNFSSEGQEILCTMVQFIVAFVIPFSMMSVFYFGIGRKLKGMSFKRQTRTGVVIGTVVIVFFVCWVPYHVVNMISLADMVTRANQTVSDTLTDIHNYGILLAGALVFFNSCANPVIYAFAARSIQDGFRVSAFGRFFDQMTNSVKEESRIRSKDTSKKDESLTLEELPSSLNN